MFRILQILLFSSLLFITSHLNAQSKAETIDKLLASSRTEWNIPGMSVGIIKDGEVFLSKGYGFIEEGKSTKVDAQTNYSIASNTKAFTVAILAMLIDEGKLDWDDKVTKYLPDFTLDIPYETKAITIRDLLCHRVGFGSFSGDVVWYKSNRTAAELLTSIPYVPKSFEFRDGYGYSNIMFMTAGEVIHAVTDISWDQHVQNRIFAPLEMNRSATSVRQLEFMNGNIATPHKPTLTNNASIDWVNWDNMGSAGAIISNVEDMTKWMQLQLNGGIFNDDTLFSKDVQEEWWTPHNNFKVGESSKKLFPSRHFSAYGLGWGIQDYAGRKLVKHGGGYDGMYSQLLMVPEENIGIIILTNSMKSIGSWMPYAILDILWDQENFDWSQEGLKRQIAGQKSMADKKEALISKKIEKTNPIRATHELVGTYQDKMYQRDIVVSAKGNKLRLEFEDAPLLSASLDHWHHDTYEIVWDHIHAWFDLGIITFISDESGIVTNIEFEVPNRDIFFDEIKAKKVN